MNKPYRIRDIEAQPGTKVSGYLQIADLNGYGLSIPLMIINGTEAGQTLLITGGTHACEYVPVETVLRLCENLNPKEIRGTVLAIPVINVAEFQARSAFVGPIDGANMGEAIPGDPEGTVSFRTGHVVWTEVASKANAVIEFHGGDLTEENIDFVIVSDTGNEKTDKIQLDIARAMNTPYLWHQAAKPAGDLKAAGGGLAGTSSRRGIPAIIPESGYGGRAQESSVKMMYDGTLNVMRYLKMLEGEPKWIKQRYFIAQHFVRTTYAGLYHPTRKVGEIVSKGDVVGIVKNFYGDVLEELKSPVLGILDFHEFSPTVLPGNTTWIIGELESEAR